MVAVLPPLGLLRRATCRTRPHRPLFEREQVPARVVGVAGEREEREHVVAEEVATPNLDRVDPQLERRLVDETFEERRRLRPPGAAVCPHRRGVRDGNRDVELDRREGVGALCHSACAPGQERADARIRAGVTDEAHLQAGEVAVAGTAEFDVLDLAAAVGQCLHVVAARWHPHDGSAGTSRRCGDHGVLGMDAGLAAEAASDLRGDHADVGGFHAECPGELSVEAVWHLGRRPERQSPVVADLRRGSSRAPSAPPPFAG